MAKEFTFTTRPAPKWIIDRFEEEWAVLQNTATYETISLPISSLPKKIKEGSTLIKIESKWYVNEADSAAREARINELFGKIKAKSQMNRIT